MAVGHARKNSSSTMVGRLPPATQSHAPQLVSARPSVGPGGRAPQQQPLVGERKLPIPQRKIPNVAKKINPYDTQADLNARLAAITNKTPSRQPTTPQTAMNYLMLKDNKNKKSRK